MSDKPSDKPKEWCIVELMGHRRLAGHVSETELFGTKLMRIDVPRADGSFVTQFYGGSAIYCLTLTTEEVARAVAAANVCEPVHRWELPALSGPERPDRSTSPRDEDDDIQGEVIDWDDLDPNLAFIPKRNKETTV